MIEQDWLIWINIALYICLNEGGVVSFYGKTKQGGGAYWSMAGCYELSKENFPKEEKWKGGG